MQTAYKVLKNNQEKLINEEYCKKCGGECCKTSACAYLPRDLDMSKKAILKKLESKEATIVGKLLVDYIDNKIVSVPVLCIDVRSIGKTEIDLLSPKTGCALLSTEGCTLKDKPSGALSLIPNTGGLYAEDDTRCKNIFEDKEYLVINEWLKYEKLLIEIVEQIGNSSFETQYKRAILKTARDIINTRNNLSNEQLTIASLLDIIGVLNVMENHNSNPELMRPTNNNLNYLRPNKEIANKILTRN